MAEKYSKWADKAGINPFFPSRVPVPSSFVRRYAQYALAAGVAVPRLLSAVVAALLFSLLLSLLTVRSVLSVLMLLGMTAYRADAGLAVFGGGGSGAVLGGAAAAFLIMALMRNRIKQLGIKVVMLVIGVNFRFQAANLRRLGLGAPKGEESGPSGDKISPGDIVLCNLTNPLEIVALEGFLHNPVFVFPVQTNSEEMTIRHFNFAGAFLRSMASVMDCRSPGKSSQTLLGVCNEARNANRCVVLFGEGVRTNGDGVLRISPEIFDPLLRGGSATEPRIKVHVLGFQYPSPEKEFSPANPVGSFFGRMFWVASYFPLSPLKISADFVLASAMKPFPESGGTKKQLDVFVAELRDILANVLKKNKVEMGFEDYESFCHYYRELAVGNIKESSAIADKRKKH